MRLWRPTPPARQWLLACSIILTGSLLAAQEVPVASANPAEQVTLRSDVDRTTARVADPIEWTLQVEAPVGSRVGWPRLSASVGSFEVLASEQRDAIPLVDPSGRDNRIWTRTWRVESLQSGEQTLPALEVQVEIPTPNSAGQSTRKVLTSEPLSIQIESTISRDADPRQFRDIKEVIEPPSEASTSSSWRYWSAASGLLGLLILTVMIHRWRRTRRLAPDIWARRRLARLRDECEGSAVPVEQQYGALVACVRQFLAAKFDQAIASQTAEEWRLHANAHHLLDAEARAQVTSLLQQHDLIRYGGKSIPREQLAEAFSSAELIIRSSTTVAPSQREPSRERPAQLQEGA